MGLFGNYGKDVKITKTYDPSTGKITRQKFVDGEEVDRTKRGFKGVRRAKRAGNFGRRQQKRGVIESERKLKRSNIRKARAAADKAGLKGKARREFMKAQKATFKGKQFENQSNRIAEINRQQAMQEAQGIIGPGGTIKQGFTPGTLKGNCSL